ncbi:Dapk1, partial [Symbiodinium sp. CCMP2456]
PDQLLRALEMAAQCGNVDALDFLSSELGIGPQDAPSLAIAAAKAGQVPVLEFLKDRKCDTMLLPRHWWLPPFVDQGTTALHEAAACGHAAAVQWLLEEKADPFLCNATGEPLHLAALHGHARVVMALAEVTGPSRPQVDSTTPLHQ